MAIKTNQIKLTTGATDGYFLKSDVDGNGTWAAGGVTDHNLLNNLDYASAGHTGFEPTVIKGNLTAGSNKISIGGTGTEALIGAGASVDVVEANLTHNNLGGLTTGDAHTQYALLLGRVGGQILIGGTAAGNDLTLRATSSATDGDIIFETDPTTERARILSTGELLVGYSTKNLNEIFGIQKNQNAGTELIIFNTTSGTASYSALSATNSSSMVGSISIGSLSAGWTTSGMLVANTGILYCDKANGLNIGTSNNTQVSFWTNNTERARILSTGELLVGETSLVNGDAVFEVFKNRNKGTVISVINNTSGTLAYAEFFVSADNGATGAGLAHLSAGFTTSGINVADTAILNGVTAGGLNVGTGSAAQLSFWTNNTKRAGFQIDGALLFSIMQSGATQAGAGAAAGELWKTSGHATLPDNVIMIGV